MCKSFSRDTKGSIYTFGGTTVRVRYQSRETTTGYDRGGGGDAIINMEEGDKSHVDSELPVGLSDRHPDCPFFPQKNFESTHLIGIRDKEMGMGVSVRGFGERGGDFM